MDLYTIFKLLILFQIKHFLADYPLQTKYHLGKFKPGWDFLGPLASHCSVHALGTCLISIHALWHTAGPVGLFLPFVLAAFDFVAHFFMDRVKAGPKYLGRFKDMTKPYFWWALGFDQSFHHCTHYAIIYMLVRNM